MGVPVVVRRMGARAGHAVAVGVAVGWGDGDVVVAADVKSLDENSACTSVGHQLRGHISRKLFIVPMVCGNTVGERTNSGEVVVW